MGWSESSSSSAPIGHELFGSGPSPIIVLNDWLCDTSTWDGARPYLDGGRFTWAFADLRGYGRSKGRRGSFTVVEGAADAIAVADAHRWEKFAIVGHSMSSLIALHLAQHHAERVTRAVVITPPPPTGFGANEAQLEASRELARGDESARGAAMRQRFGDRLSPGWSAYKTARWIATSDPEAASAYVAMFARDGLPDRSAPITAPLLAITGELDIEPMRCAAVTRALAPLCEKLTVSPLDGCGHYPMQEMPPLLVAHIERFLAAP